MTWDGTERRKRRTNSNEPVTNDDLDEALALHSEQERQYVSGLIDNVLKAFPDGVDAHRSYHHSKIEAAKAEKEFWDTAKKAVITNGVSGLFSLLKIVLTLVALGLTAKIAFPAWVSTIMGVPK